jgi:hypothetical protein
MKRSPLSRDWLRLALLAMLVPISLASFAIEEPPFEVVTKEGEFELRQYRGFIVAETLVQGNLDEASNAGFRAIAGYIFGGNTKLNASEKIAMTAPVTVEALGDKRRDAPDAKTAQNAGEKIAMTAPVTLEAKPDGWYRVHFVMPQQYTLQSLPKPTNANVHLREVAGQRIAAIRFSGFSTEEKVKTKTALLMQWLTKQGLKAKGNPQFARYDPPIMPPFLRRSEMLIEVE